ncbi:MAG: 2-oxoglutarate dehydrogenase E1 component [Spirochaetaceae bacterium]|nr:MAG: 2-oxoglutarate dehydrogenase E1 component [Spirochaetaceae bacterium]
MELGNAGYAEELYEIWLENPRDVPPEWRAWFEWLSREDEANAAKTPALNELPPAVVPSASGCDDAEHVRKQAAVDNLLRSYREAGAIYADTNPLGTYETPEMRYMRITVEGVVDRLSPEAWGLGDSDMETPFETRYFEPSPAPLREIIARARETYLAHLGTEFMHIYNYSMRSWLLKRIEREQHRRDWLPEQKIRFQKDLIKAEEFEHFVHRNFIGQKRFSLEGGEGLIPALHYLIYSAADHNVKEIVIGMAHRGRLNVFTNAMRKPAVETFAKFIDAEQPHQYGGTGDVKYHLGHSFDYVEKATGRRIHISLVANPSHLEAVDPVVEGKARGTQRRYGDFNRKKVVPVLVHGDAAFSGQGVVAETFNLSQLKGYRTGGTIHIIVNNQIGFTTASRDSRSTFFATDVAKGIQVPIFHANGDNPEAIVRAIDLAMRWRQKFGYDAVVDIICYRRLGHNEADEPSFTHPIMYKMIKDHESAPTLYGRKLATDGVWTLEEQEAFREQYRSVLREQLEMARSGSYKSTTEDFLEAGEWTRFQRTYSFDPVVTGVDRERLARLGEALTTVPEAFHLNSKVQRLVKDRRGMIESGEGIDWGFAETLSMASLLEERYSIRLSGEDSGRGTFSHRHAEWWDVHAARPVYYTPLKHVAPEQGTFSVYDSPLSEFSVLGFEYGYSIAQPDILVIWEAQFGDFVNGAQVIIDQFISSSESKWFRYSGLVMLLPHGYEGQGPEHSSAHLERFLQLCADNNMQIVNPTEPAQIFHLLRRQLLQPFRKPLIVMSPKSLLRHKEARSSLAELESGSFRTVIADPRVAARDDAAPDAPKANAAGTPGAVRTLIFCSGKVYYDLDARRVELGAGDTAIVRIEQLYPWPEEAIRRAIAGYGKPERVLWVQEESRNRGAWRFVQNRLAEIMTLENIEYVGRAPSPSPATGSYREHLAELEAFLTEAIPLPRKAAPAAAAGERSPGRGGKRPRGKQKTGDTLV